MRRRNDKSVVKSYGSTVELPLILLFLSTVVVGGICHVAEMHRYDIEHRSRRQLTKLKLTLRHESVGSKQE